MQIIAAIGTNAATDRRISTLDRADFQFFASHSERPSNLSQVEVQAFVPDEYGNRPVVALVIANQTGYSDVMLSASEAREIAESLILSANEADVMSGVRRA